MQGDVSLGFVRRVEHWAGALLLYALSPRLRSDCREPRRFGLITTEELAEAVERTCFRPDEGVHPAFKNASRGRRS